MNKLVKCLDCRIEMVSSLVIDDHCMVVHGYECPRCEDSVTEEDVQGLLDGFQVIDTNQPRL